MAVRGATTTGTPNPNRPPLRCWRPLTVPPVREVVRTRWRLTGHRPRPPVCRAGSRVGGDADVSSAGASRARLARRRRRGRPRRAAAGVSCFRAPRGRCGGGQAFRCGAGAGGARDCGRTQHRYWCTCCRRGTRGWRVGAPRAVGGRRHSGNSCWEEYGDSPAAAEEAWSFAFWHAQQLESRLGHRLLLYRRGR